MKHKAHIYFWITATLIVLAGGIQRLVNDGDATLDINVHDTYYIIYHWHIVILLAFLNFILGVAYWIFYKAQISLQKKLTKVHTVITVLAVPAYYVLLAYCNYVLNDSIDVLTGRNYEVLNTGLIILFLMVLAAQLLLPLNIIVSLIKRKKA